MPEVIVYDASTLTVEADSAPTVIEEQDLTIIASSPTVSIIHENASDILVISAGNYTVPGPAGPQGPPGASGGAYFDYVQASPAATWIIPHNLNKRVHVTLFNSLNEIVYADIVESTLNLATVTFPTPFVGFAYVS